MPVYFELGSAHESLKKQHYLMLEMYFNGNIDLNKQFFKYFLNCNF